MEKTREMSISAQILQKRKELEELEYQAKMEKANDTIDAVVKAIASRDHVREALSNFSPEEGRIIGQRMAGFIDMFTDLSMDDIAKYREKKAEREAKRKARYALRKRLQKMVKTILKIMRRGRRKLMNRNLPNLYQILLQNRNKIFRNL